VQNGEAVEVARDAYRSSVMRVIGQVEDILKADPVDKAEVRVVYHVLVGSAEKLDAVDATILDLMLEEDASAEDVAENVKNVDEFKLLIERTKMKLQTMGDKLMGHADDDSVSSTSRSSSTMNHHRYPKLELPKYDGGSRGWLQFWNQFKSIDRDDSISATHKFQYLLQCMVKGSKAREVVDSYPFSEENYPIAVADLKDRFGREDVLVEFYIRDILKLVLQSSTTKIPFHSLYVSLSAQLRALE